jgi:hypothetical protein
VKIINISNAVADKRHELSEKNAQITDIRRDLEQSKE